MDNLSVIYCMFTFRHDSVSGYDLTFTKQVIHTQHDASIIIHMYLFILILPICNDVSRGLTINGYLYNIQLFCAKQNHETRASFLLVFTHFAARFENNAWVLDNYAEIVSVI